MVNKEAFIKRLEKILSYYQLSASAFADTIGVQRSSISHILSGRNNPSLDFVLKVLHHFPEVELYWLLNGKGSFPNAGVKKEVDTTPSLFPPKPQPTEIEQTAKLIPDTAKKSIARIVIFYKDGTFEEFKNASDG